MLSVWQIQHQADFSYAELDGRVEVSYGECVMGLVSRCCSESNFSSLSVFARIPPVNMFPSTTLYTK